MLYEGNVKVTIVVDNSIGGNFIEMVARYMRHCISICRNTIEAIPATRKERHFF